MKKYFTIILAILALFLSLFIIWRFVLPYFQNENDNNLFYRMIEQGYLAEIDDTSITLNDGSSYKINKKTLFFKKTNNLKPADQLAKEEEAFLEFIRELRKNNISYNDAYYPEQNIMEEVNKYTFSVGDAVRLLIKYKDIEKNNQSATLDAVYNFGQDEEGRFIDFKDTDGDGLSDQDEKEIYFTDINNPDTDGDGLDDWLEVEIYKTDPNSPDDLEETVSNYDSNSEI